MSEQDWHRYCDGHLFVSCDACKQFKHKSSDLAYSPLAAGVLLRKTEQRVNRCLPKQHGHCTGGLFALLMLLLLLLPDAVLMVCTRWVVTRDTDGRMCFDVDAKDDDDDDVVADNDAAVWLVTVASSILNRFCRNVCSSFQTGGFAVPAT